MEKKDKYSSFNCAAFFAKNPDISGMCREFCADRTARGPRGGDTAARRFRRGMMFGTLLIAAGTAVFAHKAGLLPSVAVVYFWPVLLVVLGAGLIAASVFGRGKSAVRTD